MNKIFKILVINPGSTSTKMGFFENEVMKNQKKVDHSAAELERFPKVNDQYPLRRQVILDYLEELGVEPDALAAVVSRGGLLRPLPSGTYKVCARMVDDLNSARFGEHASNIGAVLAYGFFWDFKIPAYVVDPVVVDEMNDLARFSGLKDISRRAAWHPLNILAVTRLACAQKGWNFKTENFVVAHIGGGISVAALEHGRATDMSNGLSEGPFSPERTGALPTSELFNLCLSGKVAPSDIKKMLVGKGGLISYLGTSNIVEVEQRIEQGDGYAKLVFDGMAYQIAKEIGAYVAVLKGRVKSIILTGGAARGTMLTDRIREYVEPLAPVILMPGEDELGALAQGGLRVLRGEEKAKDYGEIP